jgi:hypothetical protein
VQLDEKVIFEYTELIEDGGHFPPLKVFDDGQNLILADGRHRYEAYKLVGIDLVPVEIIKGTERDAILYAVGANADHGLRRTNADKRYAVKTMLKDKEWGEWSDGAIAQKVRVSPAFVGKVRREMTINGFEFSSKRIGKDGRTLETSNIGSRNTDSNSGQGDSGEESPVDDNHGDEGTPTENENSSGAEREIDSATETEGNGPDAEAQNDYEKHEDNDRDVTSAETQDDGNEEISNAEEDRDASLTETQGESIKETSEEEDEKVSRESLHKTIEDNHGESTFSDVENADLGESSESEASSTVKTDDIAALRSQVFALEQIVREKDEQIRHQDQRIAELEDEVAELKKSYEYNEFESMAI